MWIRATRELLVEGAKVRNALGEEGRVFDYARGQIYVDFGVKHGAFANYSVKQKEYEQLEVWEDEE